MTPMHLERLLEIFCSPAIVSCPHVVQPTGTCTPLEDLERSGLIERDPRCPPPDHPEGHGWIVTEKGTAYVEAVLMVELPVRKWAVPDG